MVVAGLGEVLAHDDAQARGQNLHDDRHEAGQTHDPEEAVAVVRSCLEISPPVARIHVADADEKGRAGEGRQLPPETGRGWRHGHRAMQSLQGPQLRRVTVLFYLEVA